jgi:pyridinium-3,5-bisthiocarboxylic acid mononucleotide nickel chelatase
MRTLWIDPRFGASGDMLLGALIGAGADQSLVIAGLDGLGLDGWSITVNSVLRGGISATRAHVDAPEQTTERHWSKIDQLIANSRLPAAVIAGSRSTFRRLGDVEAAQHDVDIDHVHFHEVGALDSIVDIVGVWIAVGLLGVDEIVVGPVGLGHGTVETAHGRLPLPAPATAALLVGSPIVALDVSMETVTPTGAALLATLADRWGSLPGGMLEAVSRGAGSKDPAVHPNVVTMMITATQGSPNADHATTEQAVVISTNVDDVTPEVLAYAVSRLMAAGASDAWVTPATMKKGRPAHVVEVLSPLALVDELSNLLMRETGSLGTRSMVVTKHVLSRSITSVQVRGATVAVKVGPHGAKPEHDDLAALATRLGVPLRILAIEAQAAIAATARLSPSGPPEAS